LKKLIIAGTGGLAAEVTEYLNEINDTEILGYLDLDSSNMGRYEYTAPYLGHESDYTPVGETFFIAPIADTEIRVKIFQILISKGLKPYTMIHPASWISKTAKISEGNIIAPFCTIGPKASIGIGNIINYYSLIAHDAQLGDFNVLSPRISVTGNVAIKDKCFFGTSVSILPSVSLGSRCKVQAGAVVSKDAPEGSFIHSSAKIKCMQVFT